MAIQGVSSAGYNTINLTSNYKKDTPSSKPISAAERTIDLKDVSLKGTALTENILKYDSFEQSGKPSPPKELVYTPLPRNIACDLTISFNENLEKTLDLADSMNLPHGERMSFLRQEGRNWLENIKEKDPEMFVEWVRSHKRFIEEGKPHLARLPSNFTMSDYYSYVKTEA